MVFNCCRYYIIIFKYSFIDKLVRLFMERLLLDKIFMSIIMNLYVTKYEMNKKYIAKHYSTSN